MKTTRKILMPILAVALIVLCFTVFPEKAQAATSGYYTYTVSGNKATITDCNTSISGTVTIPSTLGGYSVTAIGNSAFSYPQHVAYTGSQNQWQSIVIGYDNDYLTNPTYMHYNTTMVEVNTCTERSVYCPACEKSLFCYKSENGLYPVDPSLSSDRLGYIFNARDITL